MLLFITVLSNNGRQEGILNLQNCCIREVLSERCFIQGSRESGNFFANSIISYFHDKCLSESFYISLPTQLINKYLCLRDLGSKGIENTLHQFGLHAQK